MEPWTVEPALTADRLGLIAGAIVDVRREVAAQFEAKKGDNAWSQGCRAYARMISRLKSMCLEHEWLRAEQPAGTLSLTLYLGGVPVKIVRGDEDHPSKKSTRNLLSEIEERQLKMLGVLTPSMAAGFCWQIVVQAGDSSGSVAQIAILEANDAGEVRNVFKIPLKEWPSDSNVARMERSPRRPGRPITQLKSTAKKDLSDDSSG